MSTRDDYPKQPPAPGWVAWMPKRDSRPQKGWYAPGEYLVMCRRCRDYFIGDKRAFLCADCAYGEKPLASAGHLGFVG